MNLIPTPFYDLAHVLFLPFILVRRRRRKYIKSVFAGRGTASPQGRLSVYIKETI